jgi:UrcA family protein
MFRTITTAALIALSLTTLGTTAQAADVHFGDLNLANPADAAVLKVRIADAAAQTCAVKLDFGVSASKILEAEKDQKACMDRVSAQTMAKIQVLASQTQSSASRLARQ